MSDNRLFVFGYYNFKNTGDDAMLYCLLEELYHMNWRYSYGVLASNSGLGMVLPKIPALSYVPISVFKVARAISSSSCVVLGGGTHLFSYGKRYKCFVVNLRILLLLLYAKLLGKKVHLLSIGIGAFNCKLNKSLARFSCILADYINVRDKKSFEIVRSWGLQNKCSLSLDISMLFGNCVSKKVNNGNQVLGVAITPVYKIYYGDPERDMTLINNISRALNLWMRNNNNLHVYLYVFNGGKNGDMDLTSMLQGSFYDQDRVRLFDYNPNPKYTLGSMADCTYFVGMRYHAILYAYLTGIPQIVIEYMPKCRALAEEIKLSECAILSLDDVANGKFDEAIELLAEHPQKFLGRLPLDNAVSLVKNVCQKYDNVLDKQLRY